MDGQLARFRIKLGKSEKLFNQPLFLNQPLIQSSRLDPHHINIRFALFFLLLLYLI